MEFWVSTTIAVCAIVVSIITAISQYRLNKKLSDESKKLSQHQAFIALQDKLQFSHIDYESKTLWKDIAINLNSLETFAVAWEYDFVDKDIMRRLYKRAFIDIYNEIIGLDTDKSLPKYRNIHPDNEMNAIQFLSAYAPTSSSLYAKFSRERKS